MEKLRSVNTKFWDDAFISELTPSEKLLFLYLITNPLTNLLGAYEITLRRISFDTGLDSKTIRNGFERFQRVGKAFFIDNFIILPNWLKNQRLNPNMKIAVEREFTNLPKDLINKINENDSEGLPNGYATITEWFDKLKGKLKGKEEDEDSDHFDFNSFYNEQIKTNQDGDKIKIYTEFVEFLFGKHPKNPIGKKLTKLLNMQDQITYENFVKLSTKQTKDISISDKVLRLYNASRTYKSFYLTLNNWMND